MPIVRYKYKVKLRDPYYFWRLIERRIGVTVHGIANYPRVGEIGIDLDRELTPDEKAKLDSLVAENPVPTSEYEAFPLTPEDVEAEIGVRPVFIAVDPATGMARCKFDTTLTLEQEAKLEALLRILIKFKRRKP